MIQRQFLYNYTIWMLEYSDKVLSQARKTHGYLYKKSSGLISIWQKRYFIIFEDTLTYYADEILVQAKKHIAIEAINYIKTKTIDQLQFHLVTKKRVYQLKADKKSDKELWVASLNILINYKEWNKTANQKQSRLTTKKQISYKKQSRPKKSLSRPLSPPQIKKQQSSSSSGKNVVQTDFNTQQLFRTLNLAKLLESWKLQKISSKIILLKEAKVCYFIISCKTLLFSHEDQDLLNGELIGPYDFNCLYCYEFGQVSNPQVYQICKCCQIEDVYEDNGMIRVCLATREVMIKVQSNKMQTSLDYTIKKIRYAIEVGKQYHNILSIKLKRNIDQMLYLYDEKQMSLSQLAKKQVQKCINESKQGNHKQQFRRNMESMKKSLKQIINCCQVKPNRNEFKMQFVKEYHEMTHLYMQKKWDALTKTNTPPELKKMLLILLDFWKFIRTYIKDDRLFQAAITTQKLLIAKYENQIISKIDQCFSLTQKQILDEVNIQIKDESNMQRVNNIFFSNKIYRQFHLDIRLVLFEFPEMSIHEKSLQYYLSLFANTFKHICEKTFRELDKWKDANLVLGSCNEIEFIKNSLFEEMLAVLSKEYKNMGAKLKNQNLRQLESEISNIEIMLVKKLFVMTFSDIDRNILNKPYDELDINAICAQIACKIKDFSKINKYVKRNIYEASFEEICYFYYSSIIKFNKKNRNKQFATDFFINKMTDDFKQIGQCFHGLIYDDKIYAHLKDLSLIKDFIQCDTLQIKSTCQKIKKQFGNSFTETALKNLFSLRQINEELKNNIINECSEIIKNSVDSPEEISLISSSRQSFLENWNNPRSRKSTLTLSLNEFYESQYMIHKNKQNYSKLKQGYLNKKKIIKNSKSNEISCFYKIRNGDLIEYETQHSQDPINTYDLQFIKKCYLHPQKSYAFFAQFPEVKLQFKCESSQEANEWIKNIYEEISSLSVILKEKMSQKERKSDDNVGSLQKDQKDLSTMQSCPKVLKDRSLSKSGDVVSPKKAKREQIVTYSPIKATNPNKQQTEKSNQCMKCSIGFFF